MKASLQASALLNRQFYYQTGGYTVQGSNVTQLSAVIDRVTVRVDAFGGLTEEVDFTNERSRMVDAFGRLQLTPERDFDRRASLTPVIPGQRELRQEANQMRLIAAALYQDKATLKLLVDAFHDLYGFDARPAEVPLQPGQSTGSSLPVGTPLWRESGEKLPKKPSASTAIDGPVLVGCSVQHGQVDNGLIRVTSTGVDGIAHVRVQGPGAVNDSVGYDADSGMADTFLVVDGDPAVGILLDDIEDESIKLCRVRMGVGKGGGTSGWHFADRTDPEYDPDRRYNINEVVMLSLDNTAAVDGVDQGSDPMVFSKPGLYVCVKTPTKEADDDPMHPGLIHPPLYPYPATKYWHLISLGPRASSDCVDGIATSTWDNSVDQADPML
jgi:hypothetical protein